MEKSKRIQFLFVVLISKCIILESTVDPRFPSPNWPNSRNFPVSQEKNSENVFDPHLAVEMESVAESEENEEFRCHFNEHYHQMNQMKYKLATVEGEDKDEGLFSSKKAGLSLGNTGKSRQSEETGLKEDFEDLRIPGQMISARILNEGNVWRRALSPGLVHENLEWRKIRIHFEFGNFNGSSKSKRILQEEIFPKVRERLLSQIYIRGAKVYKRLGSENCRNLKRIPEKYYLTERDEMDLLISVLIGVDSEEKRKTGGTGAVSYPCDVEEGTLRPVAGYIIIYQNISDSRPKRRKLIDIVLHEMIHILVFNEKTIRKIPEVGRSAGNRIEGDKLIFPKVI